MANAIPVLGWLLHFLVALFMAIPFYFLWNWLAPIYAYWLPDVYLSLPFWHCVGLFWLMPMVKLLLFVSWRITWPDEKFWKKQGD